MFLTGVWHLDLDFDMVIHLYYTHVPILALYFDFEGAKNLYVI